MKIHTKGPVTAALGLLLATNAANAIAEQDTFSGAYVGIAVVSQNVWGGSLVNGVDVLAQDRRSVAQIALGWRWQFAGRWIGGVEVQYGRLDGDLAHGVPGGGLLIRYRNESQYGFGGHLGRLVGEGRRNYLYAYAYETSREFDVHIEDSEFGSFSQTDEQGFLRYGFALETELTDRVRSRIAIGSYRVDFGNAVTNIDVSGEAEASLGITYRFGS